MECGSGKRLCLAGFGGVVGGLPGARSRCPPSSVQVLTLPAPLKLVVCVIHGCSETTVYVNALVLWLSDFVQMLVLRGFQKNVDVRGTVEPEWMTQVGGHQASWGSGCSTRDPRCSCQLYTGKSALLSPQGAPECRCEGTGLGGGLSPTALEGTALPTAHEGTALPTAQILGCA